jgi:hypothetical protein
MASQESAEPNPGSARVAREPYMNRLISPVLPSFCRPVVPPAAEIS